MEDGEENMKVDEAYIEDYESMQRKMSTIEYGE